MMIGNLEVEGAALGNTILFEDNGWRVLKLGEKIDGMVLAKVNEDGTASLVGNYTVPKNMPKDSVLFYAPDEFNFSFPDGLSLNAHEYTFSGVWWSLQVKSVDGNIVLWTGSGSSNRPANLFNGLYTESDLSPYRIGIVKN